MAINPRSFNRLVSSDPETNRIVQDLYDKLSIANRAISTLTGPAPKLVSTIVRPGGSGGGASSISQSGALSAFDDDFLSVKMFGAKGDGVTDDSVPIQTAINYCNAHKKFLIFPPGTYMHSATISIPGPVRLRGSMGRSILMYTGVGIGWDFKWAGSGSLAFSMDGLQFNCTHHSYLAPPFNTLDPTGARIGMDLDRCSEYYIQNCSFTGFDRLLVIVRSGLGFIEDCTLEVCNTAIDFDYPLGRSGDLYASAHVQVKGGNFFAVKSAAIKTSFALDIFVEESWFEWVQYGLLIDNSVDHGGLASTSVGSLHLHHNTFTLINQTDFPHARALKMQGGSTTDVLGAYNIVVEDNTVEVGQVSGVPENHAVELSIDSSPFFMLDFHFRRNEFLGVANAAVFVASTLIHVTVEDNNAYLTAFDPSSNYRPILDGPDNLAVVGSDYDKDYSALSSKVRSRSIDMDGRSPHSLVLRDRTAMLGDQAVRMRKDGIVTYLEAVNLMKGHCVTDGSVTVVPIVELGTDMFNSTMADGGSGANAIIISDIGYSIDHYDFGTGNIILTGVPIGGNPATPPASSNAAWRFGHIRKAFAGAFHDTGNVVIGDPGPTSGNDHIPVDDGVHSVQLVGPTAIYGTELVQGNSLSGDGGEVFTKDVNIGVNLTTFRRLTRAGVTYLDAVNDALNAIVHGFIGMFHGTGNIVIGDSGTAHPTDDGINKLQLIGDTKIYGNLTVTGTSPSSGYTGITTRTADLGPFGSNTRALSTPYQNLTGKPMFVSIIVLTNLGSGSGLYVLATSPPNTAAPKCEFSNPSATASADVSLSGWVLPNEYYEVITTGGSLGGWVEWV